MFFLRSFLLLLLWTIDNGNFWTKACARAVLHCRMVTPSVPFQLLLSTFIDMQLRFVVFVWQQVMSSNPLLPILLHCSYLVMPYSHLMIFFPCLLLNRLHQVAIKISELMFERKQLLLSGVVFKFFITFALLQQKKNARTGMKIFNLTSEKNILKKN